MEFRKYIEANNFYMPSFFYIRLNVSLNFKDDFVEGAPQNMAVFLHEYIHYLQDVSTVYGYLQIYASLAHLLGYLYYAQNCTEKEIPRIEIKDENALQLRDFIQLTTGTNEDFSYENFDSIKIKSIVSSMSMDEIKEYMDEGFNGVLLKKSTIPQLKVLLTRNHKSEYKEIGFGAAIISESMAFLIQNHAYPQKDNSCICIQYDMAKLLYEYIMQKECEDKFVVELCDIALMDQNPGAFYYLTLLNMRSHNFTPHKLGDIFEFTQRTASPFYGLLNENYVKATQHITMLFQGEDFLDLRKNMISSLTNGKTYREKKFSFLYTIMDTPFNAIWKYWKTLAEQFRIPLIITKDGDCFGGMTEKNEQYNENFFVAYNVMKNILNKYGSPKCELIDICNRYKNGIVDENCYRKVNPWEKLTAENMCPLATLWKMWGLEGKYIVYD